MHTPDLPSIPVPAGHYSPVIQHNGLLYVSGQLPRDSVTGSVPDGIEAQTELVLESLDQLLRAAGSSRDRVLQTRVYVVGIENWDAVNSVYARFFGEHRPVRAVVPTPPLHFGCLIEIEAVALAAEASH